MSAGSAADERARRGSSRRSCPRPPTMMMAMYWIDRTAASTPSGLTKLLVGAEQRAGHRRPCALDTAKAPTLYAAGCTPMTSAATSRSRTACIARPGPRAHDVLGQQRDDRDERPDQPEPALVAACSCSPNELEVVEVERADRGRGALDRRAAVAAGDRRPGCAKMCSPTNTQAERDDRQVVAAQAQRERPDERADHARRQSADDDQPERQRQPVRRRSRPRAYAPTADEEGVAERDLAGVAGQQVEADARRSRRCPRS